MPQSTMISTYACPICKYSFSSLVYMKKHMATQHTDIPMGVKHCEYCAYSCLNSQEMKEHCDQMHKFVCHTCKKTFSSHSGFYSHNRINHGLEQDLVKCQTCGKKFECVSRLKIHERSHSNTRTFMCNVCQKSYKHKYSLDSHTCTGSASDPQ